jgi:hypothetical protein
MLNNRMIGEYELERPQQNDRGLSEALSLQPSHRMYENQARIRGTLFPWRNLHQGPPEHHLLVLTNDSDV